MLRGTMVGNSSLRHVAVRSDAVDETGSAAASSDFDNCVFRICPKFSYRARAELKSVEKEIKASENKAKTRKALKYGLAKQRALNEEAQNAEMLARLKERGGDGGDGVSGSGSGGGSGGSGGSGMDGDLSGAFFGAPPGPERSISVHGTRFAKPRSMRIR